MIKKLLVYLLLLTPALPLSFSAAGAGQNLVSSKAVHSRDYYPAGGEYPVLIELQVPEGWYIHGPSGDLPQEGGEMIPTELSFGEKDGVRVSDPRFPEPEPIELEYTDGPVPLFSGLVEVRATIIVAEDAEPGPRTLKGELSYQACRADSCLPPQTADLEITVQAVTPGARSKHLNQELFQGSLEENTPTPVIDHRAASQGLWLTLAGLFLGGLALNLTPCIYPLIPITISFFGGRSGRARGARAVHGAAYMVGLAITNSFLGVAAALSGGLLGAALQNPVVILTVAAILLGLALSFFDVWEIRIPGFLGSLTTRQYGGYFGSLFMGLTLGVVAAPCLGPFVLGLLAFVGQTGDPFLGFAYFLVLSLGMGLPLAVLAVFSGAVDRLPGSGDWMVWVRKLMGWVLAGMAVYMIMPLMPGKGAEAVLAVVLAAAAGLHLGWLEKSGKASIWFRRIKKTAGLILMAAGALYAAQTGEREGIQWSPYKPGVLAEAVQQGRPVILDFTADWCPPCREMEERVFSDPDVVDAGRDPAMIRVDLTRSRPEHAPLLKRYQVRGVPTVIFIRPDGKEASSLRVESYVNKDDFLERIKRLAPTT
ncbi:MAG: cytochrome c biogenesis protein CcdA [Desulfobacteraceae bacterium]